MLRRPEALVRGPHCSTPAARPPMRRNVGWPAPACRRASLKVSPDCNAWHVMSAQALSRTGEGSLSPRLLLADRAGRNLSAGARHIAAVFCSRWDVSRPACGTTLMNIVLHAPALRTVMPWDMHVHMQSRADHAATPSSLHVQRERKCAAPSAASHGAPQRWC